MSKRILIFPLLAILYSCGKATEVRIAPSAGNEGIIASCISSASVKSITEKYGGQYRVLSLKDNLYEIYGVSKEEIKNTYPNTILTPNIVFTNSDITPNVSAMADHTYQNLNYNYSRGNANRYQYRHLDAIDAFDITNIATGSGTIVAVLDTGVHYQHPYLNQNMYIKTTEYNQPTGDHDGNGFSNDFMGWDFVNGDNLPDDDNGHGTHVAGLIASSVSGIAPKAKILPIKVLSNTGVGDLGTVAAGILYAINRHVDVINMSLGGAVSNVMAPQIQALISNVNVAKGNGIIMITAAGNGNESHVGECNDGRNVYPANIESDNIVSVASVNLDGTLSSFSNYGRNSVDIAAPGEDSQMGGLLSTYISASNSSLNPMAYLSGTSMSTGVVSGLFALVKSANPRLSYQEIKSIIFSTGESKPSLTNKTITGKMVNAYNAVIEAKNR